MKMKLFAAMAALTAVCFAASITGCSTTAQTTAYNTIYTAETTADAAVDAYYTAVIKGIATTNQVPQVSQAFNSFQAACTLAAATSEAGTNALASAELTAELGDLLTLVSTATPSK